MSVRFFVDEGSPLCLSVSHAQAAAVLVVLGVEEEVAPPPLNGIRGGPFRGTMNADWLGKRLTSVRRQLTNGRVREFTSRELPKDSLIRCLLGLQGLAENAGRAGKPVNFHETL